MTTPQQNPIAQSVQNYLANPSEIRDMPNGVQAILPVLSKLDDNDYEYLYELLTQVRNAPISNEKSMRWGRGYLGKITISDDFNDELSDDFWLGNQ